MQKISGKREASGLFTTDFAGSPVERVAYNRMAQRCQMDPDLVGPASVDPNFQQGEFSEWRIQPAFNSVVGDGFAPTGPLCSHAGTPHRIAANAAADGPVVLLEPAMHQHDVFLFYLAAYELTGQPAMCFVALGHHQQAAGGLVQAMHDSGTQLAADRRELAEVMQQRID